MFICTCLQGEGPLCNGTEDSRMNTSQQRSWAAKNNDSIPTHSSGAGAQVL